MGAFLQRNRSATVSTAAPPKVPTVRTGRVSTYTICQALYNQPLTLYVLGLTDALLRHQTDVAHKRKEGQTYCSRG